MTLMIVTGGGGADSAIFSSIVASCGCGHVTEITGVVMRKAMLVFAFAALVAGCGESPDRAICSEAIYPPSPEMGVDITYNLDWQMKRTEACVHNNAYRLASSPDPAETVAKAVMEACEAEVGAATAILYKRDYDASLAPGVRGKMAEGAEAQRIAEESYSRLALLKVVEGRAGHCRAAP